MKSKEFSDVTMGGRSGWKRDKENKEMEDSDSCVFFSDALEGILL